MSSFNEWQGIKAFEKANQTIYSYKATQP